MDLNGRCSRSAVLSTTRATECLLGETCLLGAMEALGRKPDKATFIETWAFVSPVVFAYYNT